MAKLNVALVGLGFGGAFAPIYRAHPDVGELTLFDTNRELLARTAAHVGGARCAESFEAILRDPSVDAVHLVTPIPLHAEQTLAVLGADKHCACTVPMAIDPDDLFRIAEAQRRSGRNYMMMETTLYTYQYLYAARMKAEGGFGRIQFLRGSHYQDMAGWPPYWLGLPPMWYGTHAVAPMVGLAGARIRRVCCFGSGTMDPALVRPYGNPFPVETALFEFDGGLKGEATRALFECARVYQEGMFVYGSKACFEWGFADGDDPYITELIPPAPGVRGGRSVVRRESMPNFFQTLPEALRPFTVGGNYDPLNPQDSLKKGAGGGHHGSHPHLVHEFVRSCVEERPPAIGVSLGANITAAGLFAHVSALRDGESTTVPEIG